MEPIGAVRECLTDAWRILVEEGQGASHMARDEALAQEAVGTARFFTWDPPAISLGWKQPRPEWLQDRARAFDVIERPTGGGIAFHGSDVSAAVIVPRAWGLSLEAILRAICESAVRLCQTYGVVANPVLEASGGRRITFCLLQQAPYAVCLGERKVGGFAVRRYPASWLIQGSLLVRWPPSCVMRQLPQELAVQMTSHAMPLSEAAETAISATEAARRWADQWTSWWDAL